MKKEYDIIVAGGGLSGVCAACACAREGLSVLLTEKSSYLGGAAVNCYVNPFMPYKKRVPGGDFVNRGLFMRIINTLHEMDGIESAGHTFNEEYLKLILDDLVREHGVRVLFNTCLTDAERDGAEIKSVGVHNISGYRRITADYFIDCTGDGCLFAAAGCEFVTGREEDGRCQPQTLCFRMANVDTDEYNKVENRAETLRLYRAAQARGEITNPREDILTFGSTSPGVLHINSTRIIGRDPTDAQAQSEAVTEARRQMYELFMFMKKNAKGCENSTLLSSAPQLGTRESRRVVGEYTICAEELMNAVDFYDSIAVGNYGVDIHSPDGGGTTRREVRAGCEYQIPLRALIPAGMDNLAVAGRCISSTHEAQSAYRIMPVCACMGEGAGIAVSVAAAKKTSLKDAEVAQIHATMDKYDLRYR